MKVKKLFRKIASGKPLEACSNLHFHSNYGIQGDINADHRSFRQVLILSNPFIEDYKLAPEDLRGNIIVDEEIEKYGSGTKLYCSENELAIRLTYLCEPCHLLEKVRPGLAKIIRGKRGMLGKVEVGGDISIGQELKAQKNFYPEIPDNIKEKLLYFLPQIPKGYVCSFEDLRIAMGLTKGQIRVLPTLLKKVSDKVPVHRVVNSSGGILIQHFPYQKEKLVDEGLLIQVNNTVLPTALWNSFS